MQTRFLVPILSLLILLGGCGRREPENRPPQAVAAILIAGERELLAKFSSGPAPLTVRFDGSRSHDEDGKIVKFHWDFGDGRAGEEEKPTHTYSTPGKYAVTLEVTDDRGATDRDSLTVLVLPLEEEPGAELRPDGEITVGEYRHTYRDRTTGIELHWTISGELIYLGLRGPTSGWVGIGLAVQDPEARMEGLDLILGAVTGGKVNVRDDYGDGPFHHRPDRELGGRSDILAAEGGERDGTTTLELVRKMNTEDRFDIPIINDWMVVALAYSASDDLGQQHRGRAIFQINFFKGEVRPLEGVGG